MRRAVEMEERSGRVKELLEDADFLYSEAVSELERGKIRNAAEKAWGATLRATNALIVARTGEEPERVPVTTQKLYELAGSDRVVDEHMVGRYHTRADYLHGLCFYCGFCEPKREVERMIRETATLIADIRKFCNTRSTTPG